MRYSWPPITYRLNRVGVRWAKFLPASLLTPWRVATINLRNHRKILVTDGHMAFTGGMNIRHGNVLSADPPSPVQDLHFRIEGPVVSQLQDAFANDWSFTTGEILDGETWFPALHGDGDIIARVIVDGPDADFEKARWTLLAALAEAQTSVRIVTPYFLPDPALITALNLAALVAFGWMSYCPARTICPSSTGPRAQCGGSCSSAGVTSGSHRHRSTTRSSWWWTITGCCSARRTGTHAVCARISN